MFYSTPLPLLKDQYNYINSLIKINRNENELIINYKSLDGETSRQLRNIILTTIMRCREDSSYTISEDTNKALNKIVVANNTNEVPIDYEELDTYQVKFSLKGAIQNVLQDRASNIYHNMTNRTF